jgi:SNF2 family DNA or RNA helicase
MQERKKELVDGLLEGKENKMIELNEEDIQTLFSPLESFIQTK